MMRIQHPFRANRPNMNQEGGRQDVVVSVHVPKAAGASLLEAYIAAFGRESVYADYGDPPRHSHLRADVDPRGYFEAWWSDPMPELALARVVHGHFHVEKYRQIRGPRVTVLRHPVDRLLSHYTFWQTMAPHGQPVHDFLLENRPTPVQFARLPYNRAFHLDWMFRCVDMNQFDLIGRYETMPETIAALSQLIGIELQMPRINVTPDERPEISPPDLATIHDLLSDEIGFYERWAGRGLGNPVHKPSYRKSSFDLNRWVTVPSQIYSRPESLPDEILVGTMVRDDSGPRGNRRWRCRPKLTYDRGTDGPARNPVEPAISYLRRGLAWLHARVVADLLHHWSQIDKTKSGVT